MRDRFPDTSDAIKTDAVTIASAEKLAVQIALTIPAGYKLNELAPVTWEIFADGEQTMISAESLDQRDEAVVVDGQASFDVPMTKEPGTATFFVRVSYGYCGTAENALCRLATATWRVPLTVATEGADPLLKLAFPALGQP